MYRIVLQQKKYTDQLHSNLVISKINQNAYGSNLEIVGKYITPVNNSIVTKKLIIYKLKLNTWLANGVQLNQKTEQLLKKAGILY